MQAGERFAQLEADRYSIEAASADDYVRLVRDLEERQRFPNRIVHLWSVTSEDESPQNMVDLGFYSLIFFAQALAAESVETDLRIAVVSNHMQKVGGEARLDAEKATVLGACRVIPCEFPNINCRSIDILHVDDLSVASLVAEMTNSGSKDAVVAYRDGVRWVQAVEPSPLGPTEDGAPALQDRGSYLITGGYGGLGLALAEHLARTVRARLILVGRGGLPDRSEWPVVAPRKNATSTRIKKVLELERLGAEVLTLRADVSSPSEMRAAIDEAQRRFGEIHGIFHTVELVERGVAF